MPDITFNNVPRGIITELQVIAQKKGYATVKEMVVVYLRQLIKTYRRENAVSSIDIQINTKVENETWDMN